MASMVVFENSTERAEMCADYLHNYEEEPDIFREDKEDLLETCDKLFLVAIHRKDDNKNKLLSKLYGIAKKHHVRITWYGDGTSCVHEPDRFLVSGRGHERLAYIQCL